MPRSEGASSSSGLISTLAAALSICDSPESSLSAFIATLSAEIPGLRAWVLGRDPATGAARCLPIPSQEPCPFPENVLAAPESTATTALKTGRRTEIVVDGAALPRSAEAPYLRRRKGSWWFAPVPAARPVGLVVLNHEDTTRLRGLEKPLLGALRLIQPHLAMLVSRHEMEHRVAQRTSELSLFYETSRSLAFAKSAHEIASLLGHHLGPALGLEAMGLLAVHPERSELFIEVIDAPGPASLRDFRRVLLQEARATGVDEGRPVRVRINRPAKFSPGRAGTPPADLHLPLLAQERPVGFLSARAAAGRVSPSRIRLFHTVASQAALTLERVQIVEQAGLLKIRSVLDSMQEGVLLVDRSLGVTMANPAADRVAGEILRAPLGRRLHKIGNVAMAPLMESLASGGATPGPFEFASEDSERIIHLTVSPAWGPRGVFEGAVLVISDVTQQRRMQEQLVQSEKLSSLGEMISGVAHELNNPLTSVMGYSQLLGRRELEADVTRKVEAINAEATRCQRIVQNLLQFARKQPPRKAKVDLNSVVGSVVQLLGYQLQADNIIVDVQLDSRMPLIVGDAHALQQVFVNIVNNAHHAMREKGGRGVLRIATRTDGLMCNVEISDTGPGISPEHMKRVFDPFFSTKDVGQGTGLGLSIAYSAVRDHEGSIYARSRPGQGTTFAVELPVQDAAQETLPQAAAPPEPVPVAAPAKRILVVDDEVTLSEMLCEALAAEGHEVDYAADGLSAREKLKGGRYDLIISDLKMPNMGGRELYAEVRSSDPDLARRIIFSTGDSVSVETQDFFRKTGNPHLSKPFNLSELFAVISSTLRSV
jgi:two-component system NtrC family sensor kinase